MPDASPLDHLRDLVREDMLDNARTDSVSLRSVVGASADAMSEEQLRGYGDGAFGRLKGDRLREAVLEDMLDSARSDRGYLASVVRGVADAMGEEDLRAYAADNFEPAEDGPEPA